MVLRSQFGRTRTPPGENESLVACVLRGRSEPIHAVFVEFQAIVNLQGYHLRNQKSCPTAWGHLSCAWLSMSAAASAPVSGGIGMAFSFGIAPSFRMGGT